MELREWFEKNVIFMHGDAVLSAVRLVSIYTIDTVCSVSTFAAVVPSEWT